jgi:uncharacterized protein (TIGR00369 family)
MNDKTSAAQTAAFNPAEFGWEPVITPGFSELIGPLWRRGDGLFGFVVAEKHLNFADILHGGMLSTLADQAMGMTAQRATGEKSHATIELNVQFVGAVRHGEFVEAHCEVVRLTRSIIFMRANMVVGTRVIGTASGIWKIRGAG